MENVNENEKSSERYHLDDLLIKQAHDEQGNVIDGKYDLTLSYDGKMVTKTISQENLNDLLAADQDNKIHMLGSLAGNPNMFTNDNHFTISSMIDEEFHKIELGFEDPQKEKWMKERMTEPSVKLVVTGNNLDSLSINKAVDGNGMPINGLYNVNMKFDGSSNLIAAIDQKTLDKLQTLGDYQRTKILGSLFPEVELRLNADEQKKVGQMILDETNSANKGIGEEKDTVLDATKERNEAIGIAASRYFENIYQEENQSQSVSRGIGM